MQKVDKFKNRKRFFTNEDSKESYIKVMRIMSYSNPLTKRVLLSEFNYPIFCYAITDNEYKTTFSYYDLRPTITEHSCFLKTKVHQYITYNKESKKIFFDKSVNTIILDFLRFINNREDRINLFKNTQFEWLVNDLDQLNNIQPILSKRILTSIFKGRISNYETLYRKCFSERGIKHINYKKIKNHKDVRSLINKMTLSDNVERDSDVLVDLIDDKVIIRDLIYFSRILKRKINFTWSDKRKRLEHDKLLKEMHRIKIKGLRKTPIPYKEKLPEVDGITILKNNVDFLKEADNLQHCLYTSNYFEMAMKKHIFIISYDLNGIRGTAEIDVTFNRYLSSNKVKINQFRGYKNKSLPKEAHVRLNEYLNSGDVREWIHNEFNIIYDYEIGTEFGTHLDEEDIPANVIYDVELPF